MSVMRYSKNVISADGIIITLCLCEQCVTFLSTLVIQINSHRFSITLFIIVTTVLQNETIFFLFHTKFKSPGFNKHACLLVQVSGKLWMSKKILYAA
jgi:hypothetical protein